MAADTNAAAADNHRLLELHKTGTLVCPVLLPTGRDAALVCAACRRQGIETLRCTSSKGLFAEISRKCGPVLIADDALKAAEWVALAELARDEPDWSNLPIIILGRGPWTVRHIPRELVDRRGTTVLSRPTPEAVLMSVLKADVESRRRQYQVRGLLQKLRDANRQLSTRAEQLQRLALVLTQAEEGERRRLARSLHDGLQQLLAAARVTLGVIPRSHGRHAEWCEAATEVDTILQEAIATSRNLTHDLSPPVLYQAGLGPALDQLAESMQKKHGLLVDVAYNDPCRDMDDAMRAFLFESARELLFNVHKHAGCDQAAVNLNLQNGSACLTVSDKGRGFVTKAMDSAEGTQEGFGLFGIRERIELLGGRVDIDTERGQGTAISLSVSRNITQEDRSSQSAVYQEAAPKSPRDAAPGGALLRVLVVDDHRVMRTGLVTMLSAVDGIEVVGEADDGLSALAQARMLKPDVVVMDVSMPGMDGIEGTLRLRQEMPGIQVVALSMFEEPEVADDMLAAGATAYLVKSSPTEGLIASILACRPRSETADAGKNTP